MRVVLPLLFFINSLLAFSQQKRIDSLKNSLEKYTQKDTLRVLLLAELAWSLRNSNINQAFEYNRQAVYLASEIKAERLLAKIYNHRGVLFRNISDYPEAEKRFYEALNIAQKYKIPTEEAYAYNNLGDLQRLTGNTQESIRFIEKARDIFVKIKDKRGEAYTYIRLSEAYQKLEDYEKSYFYADKSLQIRKELGNLQDVGASLNRIGDVLVARKKYEEALLYYKQAVDLAVSSNDATGKVASLQDIAKVYIRTQRYEQAKEILDECLAIAQKNKNREQERNIYEFYTELYERQNDFKNAYECYKKRQAIADSIFSNQRMLQISQMRVRYDLNETERENKNLKDRLTRERIIGFIGTLFSIFVLFSGIWIYRKDQKINKFNQELTQKNEEIQANLDDLEKAAQAIIAKNEEIEKRNQEIEIKNTDLIQSIGYALLIQEAMLPNKTILDSLLKEYFVIWEPKDIISGDFYWIADKPDNIILVLADCTGHGVPGAMMSMLGNNLLNSIIHDKEIHQPDIILEKMHQEIIRNLKKAESQINDSMEIAVISIAKNTPLVTYAGAGIPLYYLKNKELQTIMPDKTSIGSLTNIQQTFTPHYIQIDTKTQFFVSTDGYKDQFGGEQNKKFGTKQFKNLLVEIADMPLQAQKDILTRRLYLWQKASKETQTDDITVLSFFVSPVQS